MDDILGEKPTNASSPNGMVSLTMLEDNDTIAASPQPGTSSSSSCSAKERMTVKNELSHQVTSKKRSAKRRYPYWFEKFETMIEKREAMEAHSRAQHQANVEALLDIERERNANLRRIAAILEQLIKK